MTRWLVAYDVHDDDHRARVAALLSHHGVRQQRSVFLCDVADAEVAAVRQQVEAMVHPDTDVVQWFRQCTECDAHRHDYGQAVGDLDQYVWIV